MSLLSDLAGVGDNLPPSHVPTLQNVAKILGALIVYAEHGSDKFSVATSDAEKLNNLLATGDPDQSPAPVSESVASTADQRVQEQQVEIDSLKQQVQTLLANAQATKPEVL